jgi:hypothetical protein
MNKIDLCKTIQMNVSKLTESENLELFKIILDTNANYTKNNNGVFLNLNWIDEKLLVKINNYILFCIKSQNEISKYELMKTLLNDSIAGVTSIVGNTKDDEDVSTGGTSDAITGTDASSIATVDSIAAASVASLASLASVASVASDTCVAGDICGATIIDAVAAVAAATDSSGQVIAANTLNPKQKFSSSMKFYLLKKKFMKQNTSYNACLENDLSYEDYLIT